MSFKELGDRILEFRSWNVEVIGLNLATPVDQMLGQRTRWEIGLDGIEVGLGDADCVNDPRLERV